MHICKIENVHSSEIIYNLLGHFVQPKPNCSDNQQFWSKNVQCLITISSTDECMKIVSQGQHNKLYKHVHVLRCNPLVIQDINNFLL